MKNGRSLPWVARKWVKYENKLSDRIIKQLQKLDISQLQQIIDLLTTDRSHCSTSSNTCLLLCSTSCNINCSIFTRLWAWDFYLNNSFSLEDCRLHTYRCIVVTNMETQILKQLFPYYIVAPWKFDVRSETDRQKC